MSRAEGVDARIRLIEPSDSIDELTDLLHRAYASLAAQGFRYLATHQDAATTRRRVNKGECYLLIQGERLIGTVLMVPPWEPAPFCEWYDRRDVTILAQFAVDPAHQRRGLGSRLLRFAEERAKALGAREASVDTAEGAQHLLRFYRARGYREVGLEQWTHTNYRSVLLSKTLSPLKPTRR